MSCLKAGDHLLVTDSVYRRPASSAMGCSSASGVETTYYDPLIGAGIETLFRPNTVAVFLEAPGSQSFEMQDIPAITQAALASARRFSSTTPGRRRCSTAAPARGRSRDRGWHQVPERRLRSADWAGFGSERALPALRRAFDVFGMPAGPEDAFLCLRGLRTMALRLKEHEKQALEMAHWFASRPEVERVLHPALPSCPGTSSGSGISRARPACSRLF
jgi:cystathionine beta-lyase